MGSQNGTLGSVENRTGKEVMASKSEMQSFLVSQAWRVINQGKITLEDVVKAPPRGISPERWAAMLNNRKKHDEN